MALSRRCKSSFRKEGHIHFEETVICHIEEKVVRRYSIGNRGQQLASFEISKRTSSQTYRACPLAFKRANLRWSAVSLRRYAVCWCFNQSGPKRQPYGGDFHSVVQRLNPGNNSLREIPIKGTVALPSEQFRLTTKLTNVVGISHIFVRKILRPPITELFFCTKIPFWYAHNASAALEHRLSVDSQITVICYGSVRRPFSFTAARDSAVYRTISNIVGLQRELRYCDRFLLVTLFCFDCQPFRLGQNSG